LSSQRNTADSTRSQNKMRKKIVAGNWKMNMDYTAGVSLFSEMLNMINDEVHGSQQVVICPPYIHLAALSNLAKNNKRVALGAQNCHKEKSGAYTGEISATMLKSTGASYVIIGHSERRQYFNESNELLAEKVKAVMKSNLCPIFCVGETLEERNANKHLQVLRTQLEVGLFHLSANDFSNVIIAYEPVWAIGTGVSGTPKQAQEAHAFIRSDIKSKYGASVSDKISILYGGSCTPKNAAQLFSQPDIDGGLIGGASLKSRDFVDIVKTFNRG
jgi:triosephosphate isomerase